MFHSQYHINKEILMSTLNKINFSLELGQEIMVGSKGERAIITKIEFHEKSGDIQINTTRGPRRALTFSLCEQKNNNNIADPAYRYR